MYSWGWGRGRAGSDVFRNRGSFKKRHSESTIFAVKLRSGNPLLQAQERIKVTLHEVPSAVSCTCVPGSGFLLPSRLCISVEKCTCSIYNIPSHFPTNPGYVDQSCTPHPEPLLPLTGYFYSNQTAFPREPLQIHPGAALEFLLMTQSSSLKCCPRNTARLSEGCVALERVRTLLSSQNQQQQSGRETPAALSSSSPLTEALGCRRARGSQPAWAGSRCPRGSWEDFRQRVCSGRVSIPSIPQ